MDVCEFVGGWVDVGGCGCGVVWVSVTVHMFVLCGRNHTSVESIAV